MLFKLGFVLSAIGLASTTYITTCHNERECGSVCSQPAGWDAAAFSEGLFGTSCTCQPGASPTYRCTRDGVQVSSCSDGRPPRCQVPCGQQVCITANTGLKQTVTIVSACPRHHPDNTKACCDNGGAYCTCIKQDTVDINWTPYKNLGLVNQWGQETNGWATDITIGHCGSRNTGISILSPEAKEYLKTHHPRLCENTLGGQQISLSSGFLFN